MTYFEGNLYVTLQWDFLSVVQNLGERQITHLTNLRKDSKSIQELRNTWIHEDKGTERLRLDPNRTDIYPVYLICMSHKGPTLPTEIHIFK